MKIFNQNKTKELTTEEANNELGYFTQDKLFVKHHDEIQEVKEEGHYKTIAEYPNGGKDVEWVVDIPYVAHEDAYDEYEDILVFSPFSKEELEARKEEKYQHTVESLIRQKYTMSQELATLRQRDSKPEEFEVYNSYAEECKKKAREEVFGK